MPTSSTRPSSTPNGPSAFGRFAFAATGIIADRATAAGFNPHGNPRSGAPVWRNSYTVGQIEDRIWKPINGGTTRGGKRWTKALMKGAEKLELRTRAKRRETDLRLGQHKDPLVISVVGFSAATGLVANAKPGL